MVLRILGITGRILITAGSLILLFVVYLLWGTNIHTAAQQRTLEKQYKAEMAQAQRALAATTTTAPKPTVPGSATVDAQPTDVPLPAPTEGQLIGRISIPKIGLTPKVIVQGIDESQLERGPGHYPGTPLPGQKGNVSIAGHRTTYGAPFHDVDQLQNGDLIHIDTFYGSFDYQVFDRAYVKPSDVSVVQDKGDNRLTLTACHPKYSASQRIVIWAKLVGAPRIGKLQGQDAVDKAAAKSLGAGQGEAQSLDGNSLDGKNGASSAAILWGLLCAGIWLATWAVSRLIIGREKKFARWAPYLVGAPLFFLALFFFFERFVKLLPSNY